MPIPAPKTILTALIWLGSVFVWSYQGQAASAEAPYRLSGPYGHRNLEVYLIHGPDHAGDQKYLTLSEAMEKKQVIVHETGQVSELAIENRGDLPVFIQSGDIVKGGRQDRVLRSDMVVPPKSGRIPLASFCVESGRWSPRGVEQAVRFSANTKMLSSRELRVAAKAQKDQAEVWAQVAKQQTKLSSNVKKITGKRELDVRSAQSPTSLQLTLESGELKAVVEESLRALKGIVDQAPDAVGFAFFINHELNTADLYGRADLFRAMWPKLLEAAVVEAIAEHGQAGSKADLLGMRRIADLATVVELIQNTDRAAAKISDPSVRTRTAQREQDDRLWTETIDRAQESTWVHRNLIKKAPRRLSPPPAQQPSNFIRQQRTDNHPPNQVQRFQPGPQSQVGPDRRSP